MPAPYPTTLSVIISALRKLGVMSGAQSQPYAEDLELALNEFNETVDQWNLRRRKCFFMRRQSWAFEVPKQSYTIGPAAENPLEDPDFIVDSGGRPVQLDFAQLVLTDQPEWVVINIAIIQTEQYQAINVPSLSSTFPLAIYYQPTWPNGTITPYPAFPQHTSYRLNLTWRNQLDTVDMSQVNDTIWVPFGYVRALALTLAEALYLEFPKKTDLDELKRLARIARADMEANNVPPPKVSTTDGINTAGATFDWRSRQAF